MCTETEEIVEDYINKAREIVNSKFNNHEKVDILEVAKFLYQIDKDVDLKDELLTLGKEISSAIDRVETINRDLSDNLFKLLIK